jgi:acyl carrier protein
VIKSNLEADLTRLCAEVLNRPNLGPDEDLIELGMDSVTAVKVVTKVETEYGVDVVDVIFDSPTVSRLCAVVRESGRPDA